MTIFAIVECYDTSRSVCAYTQLIILLLFLYYYKFFYFLCFFIFVVFKRTHFVQVQTTVEEGICLRKKLSGSDVINRIGSLAFGKSNDAVKLVFLDPERQELIDDLDLSMVSEVKRGANGVVEVKLLNRIALLELLAQLVEPQAQGGKEAESFFSAMDKAAARLRDGDA